VLADRCFAKKKVEPELNGDGILALAAVRRRGLVQHKDLLRETSMTEVEATFFSEFVGPF
jgi:hypothetical protein